jgi:hypothetical protein
MNKSGVANNVAWGTYWNTEQRKANTARAMAWWERECSHRWIKVPRVGYIPRPVANAAPIQPLPAPSRTMAEHEARVKILRAHPEL